MTATHPTFVGKTTISICVCFVSFHFGNYYYFQFISRVFGLRRRGRKYEVELERARKEVLGGIGERKEYGQNI